MKQIVTISSDYDYSPVIVYLDGEGVIYEGDNMHNPGTSSYVEGFIDSYKLFVSKDIQEVSVYIGEPEDLEKYKAILEKTNSYQKFENMFAGY